MRWADIALRGRMACFAALLVLLTGCDALTGRSPFQLTDITGAEFGRSLQLTDHTGKARTLDDYRGKLVAVFFGYTHCPDVCPTTLGEFALIMKELGKDAERLQVLFVTVDPERDTPEIGRAHV